MNQLTGKYVVIGLGKTGLSCVRFLKHLGCDVAVIDTRSQPPGLDELKAEFSDVRFLSGTLDQFDLTTAQELIVSPGLSIRTPAIAKAQAAGVSIAGDIELFCRTVSEPVIAVTGSNGKSTVVTLLGELLVAAGMKVKVAGNIGLPVLDALLAKEPVDVWVLELSSFQLETTQSLSAQVACILNVTEDHMDCYDR
ncbi:MAG: Mur ligase family protein [Gammaproteobacteria bacterium]